MADVEYTLCWQKKLSPWFNVYLATVTTCFLVYMNISILKLHLNVLFYRSVNASLPKKTRNNGSLFAHLFIYPVGASPFNSEYASHAVAPLTVYSLPQDESINLLNSGEMPKKVRILVRHPGLCRSLKGGTPLFWPKWIHNVLLLTGCGFCGLESSIYMVYNFLFSSP